MKAIMMMFDSLNRRMLEPYGCDWVKTPNFRRLAERCVTFDNAYVGSMPCMPARRELHTGRYNFLHRSWGPLEPFDDSMPEMLQGAGVYAHLVSDHYHYWEEGGCNYHTRYNTWENVRGQEGDPWKGEVRAPEAPETVDGRKGGMARQDWINRKYMDRPEKQSMAVTLDLGLEFVETNQAEDNWFLQIETFDPHEPYFTHRKHKDLYPHEYRGRHFDWPNYEPTTQTREEIAHCRYESAALHSFCDEQLGRLLDKMDALDLWRDTLLIVNTDHGFLLGEHDWWGKCRMPFYNEIAQMPLFVWDPRSLCRGERRRSLVQTIDLPATLLEFFGVALPMDMQGLPLRRTVADDTPVREAALFGVFGGHANVTDGRWVYMRGPASAENGPLFEYTHMPTHMRHTFGVEEMRTMQLAPPFAFTKGCPLMRIATSRNNWMEPHKFGTLLFDLRADPEQQRPVSDSEAESRMVAHLERLMRTNAAPEEQYERLGLNREPKRRTHIDTSHLTTPHSF